MHQLSLKRGVTLKFPMEIKKKNILFVCSQNRLRSPTAETVFKGHEHLEAASAGLNKDAEVVVSPELIEWSDIIFVMERSHRNKLSKKYKPFLKGKRVVCLDIPDEYEYMDPVLVRLIKSKVYRYIGSTH